MEGDMVAMCKRYCKLLRFAAAPVLKLPRMVANTGISSPLSTLIAT